MATKIKEHIFASKVKHFFAPKFKIDNAKVTPDIDSALEKL